jgi:cysteine/O-acetylserine efflux protein
MKINCFQFINLKAILYGLTITSTFLVPYYQSPVILLLFSVFLAFLEFVTTCCWVLCASLFQRIFSRNAKAVNIVMAVLLVYYAVSLFFE